MGEAGSMKRQQNTRPQSMFRWLMVADGDHEESCQRFRHRRATLGSTVRAGRGGRRFFGPRVEAVGSWRFSAADSDRRGSVAIMGSVGPATWTASATASPAPPFRYRGEAVFPLVWYFGSHTSRWVRCPPVVSREVTEP